jgi:hypothetical protein
MAPQLAVNGTEDYRSAWELLDAESFDGSDSSLPFNEGNVRPYPQWRCLMQIYALAKDYFAAMQLLFTSGPYCTSVPGACNGANVDNWKPFNAKKTQLGLITNLREVLPFSRTILRQLDQGRGKTREDPVVYNGKSFPFQNAFHYSGHNVSADCSEGACLYPLGIPDFQFVGFGSYTSDTTKTTADLALDMCVAKHELTHSIVYALLPVFPPYSKGPYGTLHDDGLMNEAWSDYFAAITCNMTNFRQSFSGLIERNVNNTVQACDAKGSTIITGEIHADSVIVSGALWETRHFLKQALF